MGSFAGETLGERIRNHFGHREHLYGVLLDEIGHDWAAGGVCRELLAGWESAPAQQLPQLRLLAGLFRVVLRGEAPALAAFYPCLGGTRAAQEVWPVALPVLKAYAGELRSALTETPQTNEPGRTLALLVALSEAARRTGLDRVRLLEPGASGGLGLHVDRYRFHGDGWSWGPADSPLVVKDCGAEGFEPTPFEIVDRRGCDVNPVDASTPSGADYLRSFVWPFHVERHTRLAGALEVARRHPVQLDREGASTWVSRMLAAPPEPGVLTVIWHSVTRIYWPPEETRAMEAAVERARSRMPLAHIALEHLWDGSTPDADAGQLPQIELDGIRLGIAGHHGPPVHLDT